MWNSTSCLAEFWRLVSWKSNRWWRRILTTKFWFQMMFNLIREDAYSRTGSIFIQEYGTAYGIFIVIQWSMTLRFIESQWIYRIPCCIPSENASIREYASSLFSRKNVCILWKSKEEKWTKKLQLFVFVFSIKNKRWAVKMREKVYCRYYPFIKSTVEWCILFQHTLDAWLGAKVQFVQKCLS